MEMFKVSIDKIKDEQILDDGIVREDNLNSSFILISVFIIIIGAVSAMFIVNKYKEESFQILYL